jgi:hypothetical protein
MTINRDLRLGQARYFPYGYRLGSYRIATATRLLRGSVFLFISFHTSAPEARGDVAGEGLIGADRFLLSEAGPYRRKP